LTGDPARRADRALAAARATLCAGPFDEALSVLPIAMAEAGSSDELQQAQAELQREAQRLYDLSRMTVEQIARAIGSSSSTLYRYLKIDGA
jgi:hypothetical protein